MAEQNESRAENPPTLATKDERRESKTVFAIREVIKPLYSKDHRISITADSVIRALKRDLELDTTNTGSSNTDWDWSRPFQTRWRFTKLPLIYMTHLERAAPTAFQQLRNQHFDISNKLYLQCLTSPLKPLSNLGLSGSTFFHTDGPSSNCGLLVKSINRAFEYEFMHEELLPAYLQYIEENPGADTLLTRITDVLWSADLTLGQALNVSPRHYMVMVDVLGDIKAIEDAKKWDLKPSGFFEPTRDLIPDVVKSEATKSGLADALDANIRVKLTKIQFESLKRIIERDTSFLERKEVVDYSLLLGRFPASSSPPPPIGLGLATVSDHVSHGLSRIKHILHVADPGQLPTGDDLARGVLSSDGKWIYRFSIVDFLWNVNKLVPTVMRTAGKVLPDQTITTEPARYRKAFLEMIEEYVDVEEGH
ncbi:hypothetical protein FRC20_011049 [Serendipita sp. 405]|nr:hypothetical protein FRC20_011049 [Serendipita sp. 405]